MIPIIDFHTLGQTNVVGPPGASIVFMDNGNDVFASNGTDTVVGGPAGADTILATSNVLAFVQVSPLTFLNGSGVGTIIGGPGSMVVNGGSGAVEVWADQGASTLVGGTGAGNTLIGGSGASVVYASGSNNLIAAGTGNATLSTAGLSANDTIFGGAGAAVVTTGDGTSTVVGGAGAITADLGANTSIFIGGGSAAIYVGTPQAGGTDLVIGFRAGVDQISDGAGSITPTFTNGVFSTTLADGVRLDVFAHA